jgi:hypothetical protein
MRFHKMPFVLTVLLALPVGVRAQDSAQQAAAMQGMMQQIMRDRPPQAEMAAREMWRTFALSAAGLDSLRGRSEGEYWGEVAQLTIQHEMLSHAPDSLRQRLMTAMFGQEAQARVLQRTYRADSTTERAVRDRLTTLLDRHFGAEDSLRSLEIADVERRLAQVRTDTEQRRRNRAALVRQMVDQVLRAARQP